MKNRTVKNLINYGLKRINRAEYVSSYCLLTALISQNYTSCEGCRCRALNGCIVGKLGKGLK